MKQGSRLAGLASLCLPFCLAPLGGCGSSADQGQARPTDEAAAVSEAASSMMTLQGATLAGMQAPDLGTLEQTQGDGSLPAPVAALDRAWGAQLKPSCVKVDRSVDLDHDGIAAVSTSVLDCSSGTERGDQVTLSGVIVVRDANDNDPAGGFSVTYQNVVMTVTEASGAGTRRRIDGTMSSSVTRLSTGPLASVSLAQDLSTSLEHLRGKDVLVQVTSGGKGESTFTIDSPPSTAGGTLVARDRITLLSKGQGSEQARAWELSTDPSVHWSKACADKIGGPAYDAGAATIVDDTGASLRTEYRGCGDIRTFVNGHPVP